MNKILASSLMGLVLAVGGAAIWNNRTGLDSSGTSNTPLASPDVQQAVQANHPQTGSPPSNSRSLMTAPAWNEMMARARAAQQGAPTQGQQEAAPNAPMDYDTAWKKFNQEANELYSSHSGLSDQIRAQRQAYVAQQMAAYRRQAQQPLMDDDTAWKKFNQEANELYSSHSGLSDQIRAQRQAYVAQQMAAYRQQASELRKTQEMWGNRTGIHPLDRP